MIRVVRAGPVDHVHLETTLTAICQWTIALTITFLRLIINHHAKITIASMRN